MTTTFRPSTDLPDAPEAIRTAAKALAVRLAAFGCKAEAKTLRGATKCWTISRAAKAAHAGVPYTFESDRAVVASALEADLLDLMGKASLAGHQIADAARAA